ncbi:hypothetical protein AHAS_Ahas19G0338800 [Arachis hypogaea]
MYYSVENNTTEVDKFNKILNNLLENLKSKAASGDSRRKYGVGSASIGAGVVRASCFLRYNTSIFYDPSTPALSPLPQEVQSPSLSLNPSSAPSPQGTNNASSTAVHLLLLLLLGSFLAVSI